MDTEIITQQTPDPLTITMLRLHIGGTDRLQELLGLLPDSFYRMPSSRQHMAYEWMLNKARQISHQSGTINLVELAEIGAEACNA